MSGADAGAGAARLTPYELAFGGVEAIESRVFPDIGAEAEERGADAADPERFPLLGAVGAVLRDLLDAGGAVEQAGPLLYHGYHFWKAGKPLYVAELALVRHVVEAGGGAPPDAPHAAGYVQLPRHLFWTRIEPSATPEPVDGFFWVQHARTLSLLYALGLRPGRPGFSVVPVRAEAPRDGLDAWARAEARPGGADFANILPGGELDRLYALETEAEALKLAALLLGQVERGAGRRERAPDSETGVVAPRAGALPPSRLAFRRLRLAG